MSSNKMILIYLLALSILISAQQAQNCLFVDDVSFGWTLTNDTISLSLGKWDYMKWVAVGFNNNNATMQGATIFMFYENKLFEYYSSDFDKPTPIREIKFNEEPIEKHIGDRQISFQIALNSTTFRFLDQTQRLLVAYNTHSVPKSEFEFEKHTFAVAKDLNFFQESK
jgi:hypothetical protein